MRVPIILLTLIFGAVSLWAGNDPIQRKDSAVTRQASPQRMAQLIDSILDLPQPDTNALALLYNYQAQMEGAVEKNPEFDLNALSFYSASDEKLLFPFTPLDSLPGAFDLTMESDYLSYYFSPIRGVVTSNFGWRDGRAHKGIDIDLRKGDLVSTVFDGKVRVARYQGGFGNVVIVMHPNGLETVYAHLSRLKVKEGDIVLSGQAIGLGGNTGHSTGSHLHFEVHYKGHALNPAAIISFTEHHLYHDTIRLRKNARGLSAFPSNCNIHKVSRGESWSSIAQQYGLSLKDLMALNGVGRRYYLRVGEQLRIN